jgi:hypothetical protein
MTFIRLDSRTARNSRILLYIRMLCLSLSPRFIGEVATPTLPAAFLFASSPDAAVTCGCRLNKRVRFRRPHDLDEAGIQGSRSHPRSDGVRGATLVSCRRGAHPKTSLSATSPPSAHSLAGGGCRWRLSPMELLVCLLSDGAHQPRECLAPHAIIRRD